MNEIETNILNELESAQNTAINEKFEAIDAPVMDELKKAEALLGIGAGGGGTVKYAVVDYQLNSSIRRVWAYWTSVGWKYTNITEGQVGTIGKVLMEADSIDAWWKDSQIVSFRCWKKF